MELFRGVTSLVAALALFATLAEANLIYPPLPDQSGSGLKEYTPLYVGLIESYDPSLPDDQLSAVGTVVGAEIAMDHINADTAMLPGYSLHFNFVNSQVQYT